MEGSNYARRTSHRKRELEESSGSSCGSRPGKIPRHESVEEEELRQEELRQEEENHGYWEEQNGSEGSSSLEEQERESSEEVDGPRRVAVPQVEPERPSAGPSVPILENHLSGDAGVLARAMAESLLYHEAMKAKYKKPLVERSIEEIMDTFCDSQILLEALCKEWFGALFGEKVLKLALVELVQQERQCTKWYPCRGTHQYFKSLATKLMESGDRLLGDKEFVPKLETRIRDETEALICGYSIFPQGNPGGVPQMFADLQGSEVEVIDLLDD
ncbi:hypothetical protein BSKO_12313 [Bryopsis sp. KO-2023]|nr:hypothetical protein BSKO_12313 [Bryopsis sp. KO-2023]